MPGAYEGRLALVTGASSGFGRALARRLAGAGAALALVGRDAARLSDAASECRARGVRAEVFAFDLAAAADRAGELVADVERGFGAPVEVLVHAASRRAVGWTEDVPASEVRDVLAVNLLAPFALAAALLPGMKRRGSGHLVLVTSGAAHHGVPLEISYSAGKAGVERLAEGLRLEAGAFGVRVTLVSPGPMETPLLRRPAVFGPGRPLSSPAGADPDALAAEVLRRLPDGPDRIELSWRPRLVRWLGRAAPSLLARLLRRAARR